MRNSHTKKFSLLVICVMLLIFVLSSCCDGSDSTAFFDIPESRLVAVDSGNVGGGHFLIVKDNETGVHYLFVHAGYKGGLSVMCNADGTPYIGAEMDGGAENGLQ